VTTDPPEAKPASAASVSEPYPELILNGLARGLNAMSIFQEMVDRLGFPGAYESVKRFVRKLRIPASPTLARSSSPSLGKRHRSITESAPRYAISTALSIAGRDYS
jgi:hypothetical protein